MLFFIIILVLTGAVSCGRSVATHPYLGPCSASEFPEGSDEADLKTSFIYYEGRLVSESLDFRSDGTIDIIRERNFNEEGWEESFTEKICSGSDDPCRINFVRRYYRNEHGLLTRETYEPEGKGISTYTIDYFYDESNRPSEKKEDEGADGSYDLCWIWTYEDNMINSIKDEKCDGVYDRITTQYFNENGRVEKMEIQPFADGVTSLRYEYLYDELNRLVKMTKIDAFENSAISECLYHWSEFAQPVEELCRELPSGKLSSRDARKFLKSGNLKEHIFERPSNAPGTLLKRTKVFDYSCWHSTS